MEDDLQIEIAKMQTLNPVAEKVEGLFTESLEKMKIYRVCK